MICHLVLLLGLCFWIGVLICRQENQKTELIKLILMRQEEVLDIQFMPNMDGIFHYGAI